MATITSANSVFMLGAAGLYNIPVEIQGYATDDAFTSADVEMAETLMGVDGKLSGGYTPYPVHLEFTLQADSKSLPIVDAILQYQDVQREVLSMNATIMLPSVGMTYAFTNGFFTKSSVFAGAKKVLQPRKFELVFNNVLRAPI